VIHDEVIRRDLSLPFVSISAKEIQVNEVLQEVTRHLPHLAHKFFETDTGKEVALTATAIVTASAPAVVPIAIAATVISEVDFFNGPKAHELSNVIKQHALAGTAIGFIPVPGADVAAMVANTWTMYVRINKIVGVSFGENALKSIASGIIANLASVIPGVMVAIGAGSLLKIFPGIGTAGGIAVAAVANVVVMYVAGKVYLKSLEMLIRSRRPLTEENIKQAAAETSKDKAFVKSAYAEGRKVAKSSGSA